MATQILLRHTVGVHRDAGWLCCNAGMLHGSVDTISTAEYFRRRHPPRGQRCEAAPPRRDGGDPGPVVPVFGSIPTESVVSLLSFFP